MRVSETARGATREFFAVKVVTLKQEGPGGADRYLALLTIRERQIVRLLSCSQLNKEIAYSLGISQSTVKGTVSEMIYRASRAWFRQ
jgi:DNA-binding NarL/FixJ family response regulator